MKQKWLLTGTALLLAAALDAANIDAADADISSATLSEVAGVTCYKVEFTSGNHTYAYSINAESGEVLEGSKTQYQHRFYYLESIRSAGVKTAAEKDLQITNCPNCGAPTQVTSSGECEYCHSVITNGDFGWVLNQYMAW